jgi:hypothetical protein
LRRLICSAEELQKSFAESLVQETHQAQDQKMASQGGDNGNAAPERQSNSVLKGVDILKDAHMNKVNIH